MTTEVFTQAPIRLEDVSMVYGTRTVLSIPSLDVNSGEVLVVIGPNGSGKTTLLLNMALLIEPTTGFVSYFGKRVNQQSNTLELRRRVSVAFQEPLLIDTTVWNNVMLGLRLHRINKKEARNRARKWLERFGMLHMTKHAARTLSGGEAKRVSLARSFALEPDVLFLDEPFTGLDSPTRQSLTKDFESVLRETKLTTVMVTHDRNEALALASRVVVLINGKIRQIGLPEQVFNYPIDEEVANFVEAGNIWPGRVCSQNAGIAVVDLSGKSIEAVSELPIGTNVTVCLKYEDVTITLPFREVVKTSARNSLTGTITKMYHLGAQVKIIIDADLLLTALITRRSVDVMSLKEGQTVTATFKATAIHLIAKSNTKT